MRLYVLLVTLQWNGARLAAAVSLLVVGIVHVSAADSGYWHDTGDLPDQSSWMRGVSDSVQLLSLSLPGTHDSGSLYGYVPVLSDHAVTQTLTIDQQLRAGIRFLDIRLSAYRLCSAGDDDHCIRPYWSLYVYHGIVNQQLTFDTVLAAVRNFLDANPSEVVVMRVKNEGNPAGVTDADFENELSAELSSSGVNAPSYYANIGINLTLGSLRGKLLILADFSATTSHRFGIAYSAFANIQDNYDLSSAAPGCYYSKWLQVRFQSFASRLFPFLSVRYCSFGVDVSWSSAGLCCRWSRLLSTPRTRIAPE